MKAPFDTLDQLDLNYRGFQINLLRNDVKLRKAILEIFVFPALIAWALFGSDSTADQVAWTIFNIPNFLLGKTTHTQLFQIYNGYYGLGTHWSAVVIYGLMLVGTSYYLNKNLDIHNSLNISLTTGFVCLAIATFEFYWQISYAIFQNQWWVLKFQYPQARILIQNFMFLTTGLIVLFGINWKNYKLNIDKITVISFFATIMLIFFWWFYPFEITQLTVQTNQGIWVSNNFFPQTMYTIALNKNVAMGTMFYVANEGVHLINSLTKIMMTITFYSLFKIKYR